ncbi:hypothetical protein [Methylobacterium gregans]|uniref:Uncharacterized protein n=1 Tax=Methylobacterium gregans TaxID=374424 RepID=A0AA37HUB9_9HYPH|nr:hypothetical protein [Methylobacterium gregans]MDQ0522157.1 hypothetical protein [Methylobacterium gregans]GJD82073.1 hypothetical protein NBEOAGPD_5332 [Methylobacterium gregans]GLS57164.1 hypothetical protein GCM10007886_53500 [Methylobacterium gregans]
MNPLKAGLIVLICLILFWLGVRLARRAIDLGIAAGYEAERRRKDDEERP